ncbi:MAG: DMT family transporter [Chloroflexi bacterium]|nr:DMT family transporter [Chloroflexota bacterium]
MTGLILGLTTAFIWATSSLIVKAWSARVDTLALNAFRLSVSGIFFLALLPFFGGLDALARLTTASQIALAASVIIGVAIGDSLFFWSMTQIGAARAMPISGIYPLFTWALAVPILGEPITPQAMFGTAIVMLSLYLLAPVEQTDTPAHTNRAGTLGAIVAAMVWAGATVLMKMGMQTGVDVITINAFRMPIGALALLALVHARRGKAAWRGFDRAMIPGLIVYGLYSTGLGALVWTWSVEYTGAARAALLVTFAPLIGAPLAAIFLRERITPKIAVGTLMSVVGIWLIL